mgnify:CR=1 FL=1
MTLLLRVDRRLMKRALIFDFGGVLMKTVDYTPRHRWDDRLNLPHGSIERIVHNQNSWVEAQHGTVTLTDYWQDVAAQLKLNASDLAQLAHDFYSGDVLDNDLIAYIRERRAEGFTVALLSNDARDNLLPKLDHHNIRELFNPLIISSDIGVMKPDPAAYHAILKAINRPADETIFIDDRLENIDAAQSLGIHGIHYKVGMNLPDTLASLLLK